MTCALVIFLWIYDESNYDQFHEKKDRLYQVFRYEKRVDGSSEISSTLSNPLAQVLLNEIPEIKAVTRVPWSPKALFKYNNKAFFEQGIKADTSFFDMFSFKLTQGDPAQVLKNPANIVISQKLAAKYFGTENPVGKQITLKDQGEQPFIVSGIFEDVKANSTLKFDYVTPFEAYLALNPWMKDSWGNLMLSIYIETKPNVSQSTIDKKIKDIFRNKSSFNNTDLFTQAYSTLHLYPQEYKDKKTDSLITVLFLMGITALIILIIACINFANLSTALSAKRSREIGIKKVLGSVRIRLIWQFLSEALIISAIGMLLTITFTELILPRFNQFFSKSLELNYFDPLAMATIVVIWLITAFISGIYPAFVISSFKPTEVLKSNTFNGLKGAGLKRALVVFQFSIAITLIIFTLAVTKQVQFVKNKNLGLDKENIVLFSFYDGISNHKNTFKQELESLPGVENVTYCSMNPLNVGQATKDPSWEGKKPDDDHWFSVIQTDFDFVKTFGIRIKEGRDFSPAYSTDTMNFVINEEAAKTMGLDPATDQKLSMWGKSGKIIGVVKNFHIDHLSVPIKPLVINIDPANTSVAFVRMTKGNNAATVKDIEKIYKKYESDYPFEYIFQTDYFKQAYKTNLFRIGTLSSIFSVLAIIISCLGLYGLSSFAAEQRTKEIGVRKVNGARIINIIQLLIFDFLKWVTLAYAIGISIAFFLTREFMGVFAFHAKVNVGIFIYAGLAAFGIAIFTVCWQAYRAASRNPVDSLRYE
jgi:ABC-type antimicrobial peptide transport system permease subunit